MSKINTALQIKKLQNDLAVWAKDLGFQGIGVSDIDLSAAEDAFLQWLQAGFHGQMHYMSRHGSKRTHPEQLVPGTLRVICVRMDYWPAPAQDAWSVIHDDQKGFISRYALGRDYHKVMRRRLVRLAERIAQVAGPMQYRVFCDSAPVLEKALAEKSGLGWVGKHSNLLNREHGSYFFLGEIYTDLPLAVSEPVTSHCGQCQACLDVCPTQAIVAPYQVDARRCISYLTIELRESIPEVFRSQIGNRIYGCDDCQLVCPWNKFAQNTHETDFFPRHGLDAPQLVSLFMWTQHMFEDRLAGSPIRRIGYDCWLRNIAVALGNARTTPEIIQALQARNNKVSAMVQEHIDWALTQHGVRHNE